MKSKSSPIIFKFHPKLISGRQNPRSGGFALVISLLLMGFMVLMLLSLVTVSRVEMFSAATHQTRTQAEQNALLGLTVAIGNLQESLGGDQRVSATAQMLDKSLVDDSHMANWIGAWDAAERLPDGSANPDYKKHIAWLVSGFDRSGDAETIPAYANPFDQAGALIDPNSDAVLLGEGTLGNLTVTDYVAAPKVQLEGGGSYAYWVADEGLKARINLVSRTDMELGNYPGATDSLQGVLALSAPSGGDARVFSGLETMSVSEDPDLAKNIARAETHSEVFLADPLYSSLGTPRWQAGLQEHYHSTSLNSLSLQTDTKSGGLKKDLSLLFELDDADFADTPYTGQSGMDAVFTDSWAVFPPSDLSNVYVDPVSGDEVSYLFKEPIPLYGSQAFVRGPTWSYLRDFYRGYKGVSRNNSTFSTKVRPFGPNASDFSGEGGMQGLIATWESDKGGDIENKDNYINTVVFNDATGQDEPVTRLTEHEMLPVLNRVIFIYSLYNDKNVVEYEYVEGEERVGNEMFREAGGVTDAIALTIEPFVYLWNPYNVALEFDGGFKIHARDSPFGLMVSVADPAADIIPPIADTSVPQMSGFLDGYGRITGRGFGTLDLVIGDGANTIRMEPGEVLLFSPGNATPATIDQLPRSNEEHGTRSAPYLEMKEGFRNHGGIILGRRLKTNENIDRDGLFHQLKTGDTTPLEINVFNWGLNEYYSGGGGANTQDRRFDTSRAFNLEFAYVPNPSSGGSLYTEDTFIQRLFLNVYGPMVGNSRGPLVDLLYSGSNAAFPMSVNRAQLASEGKQPFLYFGLYQNPVVPDSSRVSATSEFIGSMSPFAPLLDKQFSNHSIDSPPYTVQIGGTDDYSEIQQDSGQGYFGTMYSAGGKSNIVVSEAPTYPLQSLASLQHARISPSTYMPGQAIGNSWASGFVDLDKTYTAKTDRRYTLYDISYLSNEALFDEYFFSSLTPRLDFSDSPVSEDMDLESTLQAMVDTYLNEGEAPEVLNERYSYIGSTDSLISSDFVNDLSAIDGFSKSASYFAVKGGFNVNSLSVDAWDSFLASTLGADYTVLNPSGGLSTEVNGDLTIFPRSTLSNGSAADDQDEWVAPRGLTSAQRRALASSIVTEVRTRGPFLSMSDFINRRLVDDDTGKKGVLQTAIDRLDINDDAEFVDAYTSGVASGTFDVDHVTSKSGVGTPQYLTQADLLTPLAAAMTVRSDTFLIRSYGEVNDPLTGEVQSRAWCEALVQRMPEFVNPEGDEPETQISKLQDVSNKTMGRRFRVISFRWLGEDDV
ncbi:hypothetical protein [Cerasicoccus frondis]|uniref:hypothetical protein n=1 Tax=Cerasicoccus frondis TaxID=490090 RepID=UPI002852D396|nr:hypothetical protein [Cerasicoccus frondis]